MDDVEEHLAVEQGGVSRVSDGAGRSALDGECGELEPSQTVGMLFSTSGFTPSLSSSVSRYSTAALAVATHQEELQPDDRLHVHLDAQHMGVGGHDSWTRLRTVGSAYYVPPEQLAIFSFNMQPILRPLSAAPHHSSEIVRPVMVSGTLVLLRALSPYARAAAAALARDFASPFDEKDESRAPLEADHFGPDPDFSLVSSSTPNPRFALDPSFNPASGSTSGKQARLTPDCSAGTSSIASRGGALSDCSPCPSSLSLRPGACSQRAGTESGALVDGQHHGGDGGAQAEPQYGVQSQGSSADTTTAPRAAAAAAADSPAAPVLADLFLQIGTDVGAYPLPRAALSCDRQFAALIVEKKIGGPVVDGNTVFLRSQQRACCVDVEAEAVAARWSDTGEWQSLRIERCVSSQHGTDGSATDHVAAPELFQHGDIICLRAHTGKLLRLQVKP